jgi:hypothetical protein
MAEIEFTNDTRGRHHLSVFRQHDEHAILMVSQYDESFVSLRSDMSCRIYMISLMHLV